MSLVLIIILIMNIIILFYNYFLVFTVILVKLTANKLYHHRNKYNFKTY